MHSIIVFASGAGSNTMAIINHFRKSNFARVVLIVVNNAHAGVLDIAQAEAIPFLVISRKTLAESLLVEQLSAYKPSLIVLAGFLWKVPADVIAAFPGRIINLHPALLPHFGGKGMYGIHVHKAVLASGNRYSGITIHFVNEHYDSGETILQATTPIIPGIDPQGLSNAIHKLEHFYLPRTIEFLLTES
jgi:phosphoribosylglycinamide formyltransferase-1